MSGIRLAVAYEYCTGVRLWLAEIYAISLQLESSTKLVGGLEYQGQ